MTSLFDNTNTDYAQTDRQNGCGVGKKFTWGDEVYNLRQRRRRQSRTINKLTTIDYDLSA
jgi:hypothetical protein